MAFQTAVWRATKAGLEPIARSRLGAERTLEDWIVADLSILGDELLLLGRQVRTIGGPLDILAMDGDGTVVIAELKRDRTPREVVAQILDYASWVRTLALNDIEALCLKTHAKPLAEMFRAKFESGVPENAGSKHRMVVVAAELDDSSERIIGYLQDEHEIDINAVFFSFHKVAGEEILVRAWLGDPEAVEARADRREKSSWSGLWFVNNGVDDSDNGRDWEACRKFGYLTAGGAEKYSRPLHKLSVGDTIAAYQKKYGYVGVGRVENAVLPADDYHLTDGRPLKAVAPKIRGAAGEVDGEYAIRVAWSDTVSVEQAKTFTGIFANQNVVCKLRHQPTIDFLHRNFAFPPTADLPAPVAHSGSKIVDAIG